MATYEIKNYMKLLCIRIEHFESFIVAEKNTDQIKAKMPPCEVSVFHEAEFHIPYVFLYVL